MAHHRIYDALDTIGNPDAGLPTLHEEELTQVICWEQAKLKIPCQVVCVPQQGVLLCDLELPSSIVSAYSPPSSIVSAYSPALLVCSGLVDLSEC